MLRATFTKIKRACVITLVPRIVRGDGRYTTRKFGKASINVLRKAGKTTDSGSKDGESESDKCRRFIDYVFGSSKPKTNTHIFRENKPAISNIQKMSLDNVEQTRAKADIESDKQNSLLKDFIGVDEDVLRKDYFNKNANLQTAASDKHKWSHDKDNLYENTFNIQKSTNLSKSKRDGDYDHIESSSDTSRNIDNDYSADDYERKRSKPRDTDVPNYIPPMNYRLQATTAKANEEKSSQKIEDVEESPYVDCMSPKIEGFSVAQKDLADRHPNVSTSTNEKCTSDFHKSIDEIAKKCMDLPVNQVDTKLIQEIEKCSIAHTNKHRSSVNKDIVKIDNIRKPEKPLQEIEIYLDSIEDKRKPVNSADDDKLRPSFEMPPHLDQSVVSTEERPNFTSDNAQMNQKSELFVEDVKETESTITDQAYIKYNVDLYDSRPQYDVNQPIIDPYGKKTLTFDNSELDEAVVESKLLDDQRIGKPSDSEKHESVAESCLVSSGAISLEQEYKQSVIEEVEDRSHLDHVQSIYDCAPRELNWRPYPSFEAREEVLDFYTQQNVEIDSFKLSHTGTIPRVSSEPEPVVEPSNEIQSEHIYSSTSVNSDSREQISHSFVQPQEMINPLLDKSVEEPKIMIEQPETIEKNLSGTLESLPSLNPDGSITLSELLRRVRIRNRMEYCREFAIHTLNVHAPETLPAEGKCGKKPPQCPPPPPKCPPPCPPRPTACPKPPPPCPKPCKPPSKRPCPAPNKNPCKKFSGNSIREVLTLLTQNNPQMKIPQKYLLPILTFNVTHSSTPTESEEDTFVHENFVFRLNVLGKIMLFHCAEGIDANLPRNRSELSFARDFEPWTPIPSWPISKQEEKKRFVCPKECCKILPPPKLKGPCKENPCLSFPKRSNFSLTDLFSFSLVESLVCHTV